MRRQGAGYVPTPALLLGAPLRSGCADNRRGWGSTTKALPLWEGGSRRRAHDTRHQNQQQLLSATCINKPAAHLMRSTSSTRSAFIKAARRAAQVRSGSVSAAR